MIVASSKEFVTNQNKYFNLAVNDEIFIKRKRVYHETDEDFYKSITKDELLKGIHEDIDKFFANK